MDNIEKKRESNRTRVRRHREKKPNKDITSIQVSKKNRDKLHSLKNPEETLDQVLNRLLGGNDGC